MVYIGALQLDNLKRGINYLVLVFSFKYLIDTKIFNKLARYREMLFTKYMTNWYESMN
jgi:hypothetical protein